MCRTFVGHPISMWWTEEIPPPPTTSSCWLLSTRQDITDLRRAVSRNSTTESCCWFCSSTVDLVFPPTFPPPQPTVDLVTITSPVIARPQKKETKGCSRDKDCGSDNEESLSPDWVFLLLLLLLSLSLSLWKKKGKFGFEVLEKVFLSLFYWILIIFIFGWDLSFWISVFFWLDSKPNGHSFSNFSPSWRRRLLCFYYVMFGF